MSAVGIAVIVVLAVLVLLFLGGLVGARRHAAAIEPRLTARIAAADRALEAARAQDRGWDRAHLEQAARQALEREDPGFRYDALDLVLVEDRPGTEHDRAHMRAVGAGGEARTVVLARHGDAWAADSVS